MIHTTNDFEVTATIKLPEGSPLESSFPPKTWKARVVLEQTRAVAQRLLRGGATKVSIVTSEGKLLSHYGFFDTADKNAIRLNI